MFLQIKVYTHSDRKYVNRILMLFDQIFFIFLQKLAVTEREIHVI